MSICTASFSLYYQESDIKIISEIVGAGDIIELFEMNMQVFLKACFVFWIVYLKLVL